MRFLLPLLVFLGGWGTAQDAKDQLRRAPAFQLSGEKERLVGLEDLRGKLVLLVFIMKIN